MKMCMGCQKDKDLSEFYKQARAKDGYQRYCKVCANIRTGTSNAKKPEKYRGIRKDVRARFQAEVREYKSSRGCTHCGNDNPICLELHHTDPTAKDMDPSMATSRKLFYEEADKCIVLCCNCHRIEHERIRINGV